MMAKQKEEPLVERTAAELAKELATEKAAHAATKLQLEKLQASLVALSNAWRTFSRTLG